MSMTQLPAGPALTSVLPDQAGRDSGRPTAGHGRLSLSAVALAAAGLLFVLYPAIRPFSDETSLAGAQAFASAAWTLAHTFAVLGFIGLCLGLLGVYLKLAGTPAKRVSFMALVVTWIGAGLILPYYGAETYGLRAIGRQALGDQNAGLLGLASQVRGGPGVMIFGAGLVLLAAGGVLAAAAAWRSGGLTRWGAALLGTGLVLFIPQFWGPQPVRIAHGILMAAGCLLLAGALWRRGTAPRPRITTRLIPGPGAQAPDPAGAPGARAPGPLRPR